MAKSSNGNVRMVITEEKILANIEKVKKMINPNSKKRIVKLEEDSYFLDLIASIKSYLEEYPKQDVFPRDVYDAAYDLVEYATTQFEENTKKIEELIRQRESNIALASELKEVLKAVSELNKKENVTVVLITHYMEEVIHANKVYVMDGGNVVMQGTPREIFSQVETLKKYRLDVPQVTLLAHELHKAGVDIPEGILTKEELVGALCR